MMKRVIPALLAICLTLSPLWASAAGAVSATEEQTVRALGIMTGDAGGNMNLPASVTRAEFVKMLVCASACKDSAGDAASLLLYRDVKQTHWAAGYIRTAVDNGWVTGYADGTFRPGNTITLGEAASALLRLLGYTSEGLSGLFPTAQMSKFQALGLGDGLTKTRTQTLTRADCATIFCNLMNAAAADGAVYAQTLGYALNSEGKLDYSALIGADLKGPFVLEPGGSLTALLPFSAADGAVYKNGSRSAPSSAAAVYKNGSRSAPSSAAAYDVFYYNQNLKTVWLYDAKASGVYTAVSPSAAAPATVTVAGNSYRVETSAAAYQLSSLGQFSVGDTVTLLLGMDGAVVDVVSAGEVSGVYYGVVTSHQADRYTAADGKVISEDTVQIACTDGVVRRYAASLSVGNLVSVTYSGSGTKVSALSARRLAGQVDSSGTKLGTLRFADGAEILDTNSNGGYAKLYPSRLAGAVLDSGDVRYYVLDESGAVSRLILNDATGDLYAYGLLTGVNETNTAAGISSNYEYVINGTPGALSSTSTLYGVSTGGAIFRYKDGAVDSIKNLKSVSLNSLNELYAMGGSRKYLLSDAIQVYEKVQDSYCLTTVSTVADTERYSLRGYADEFGYHAGGRLRVIVAIKLTD